MSGIPPAPNTGDRAGCTDHLDLHMLPVRCHEVDGGVVVRREVILPGAVLGLLPGAVAVGLAVVWAPSSQPSPLG